MPSSPQEQPRRHGSRWTRAAGLVAISLLPGGFVATAVGLSLTRSRSLTEERARATTMSVARIIELDLDGVLGHADLALRWALEARGRGAEDALDRPWRDVPYLEPVRVADARGEIRMRSARRGAGPAPSVASLDIFRRLRDGEREVISAGLVPDPVTGDPGVLLGRRMERSDGSFEGILFTRVGQARLSRALGLADLGPHGLVVLRGADLQIICRVPPAPSVKPPPGDLAQRMRAGDTSGVFLNQGPVDGVRRMVAYRRLEHYPFLVVTGSAPQDYFAPWRREAFQGCVLTLGFLALSLVVTLRLRRSSRREVEADAAVASLKARAQTDALKAALYEIAQAALESPSLQELYRRIHGALAELLPARNFYVALLDARTGLMSFPYFVDERDSAPVPRPLSNSVTDRVLRTGRPLLITPENARSLAREEGTVIQGSFSLDWLGVPLLDRDVPFGVMAVQSYSDDVRYTQEDVQLLGLASAQVASSILRKQAEEDLRASEDRFARAYRANPDAVCMNSLVDGRYLAVNEGFTRLTGWGEAESLGKSARDGSLDVWADPRDRDRVVATVRRLGRVERMEVTLRRKDGGLVVGLLTATLLEIGGEPSVLSITRDITADRAQARQLERMTRLYAALSHVSQAVVLSAGEEEMLERICRVLVEDGKFSLSWLAWDDPTTHRIHMGGRFGDASRFLDGLEVRSDDSALGQGATGIAIRERRTVIVNDFQEFMEHTPWRDAAAQAGFAASAALPVRRGGAVCGALMVYATERGVFGELEVALLEEVAATLSFALDHLDLERGRLQAEATLRREHLRAETYLQVAEVVLVALDPELRVTMLNRKGHDVLGREPGSLLGRDWVEATIPPERVEATRAHFQRLLRGEAESTGTAEAWLLRGDGDRRLLAWNNTVLRDEAGRATGILSSGTDVTERRKAEEEREVLHAQLAQAQKLESLGSLAGGVAHDMNNVLAAILAMASAQAEVVPPGSPVHRGFERIIQAAVRGGKMVKSLLSFARKKPSELREVDLGALLLDQAQLLEHTTLSRVHLEMDLEPALLAVRGDASALSHVILNLCVNAVDAMPEGGSLVLRTRNLGTDQVLVEVADSGVGMPPEVLEKALDPFFTTKPEGRGTGLGLSMAYSTVKAHGGTLEIRSEPGQGTRVRLVFPAVTSPAASIPSIPGPEREGPRPGLTVLLVDDDDLVRESQTVLLETLGHAVRAAASGEEGLAALEEGLEPDVVILDMNMPGLGGPGTLDLLRRSRPRVPVLVATGRVDQSALDLVRAHEGVTLMPKPFEIEELRANLARIRGV
jgi:PAS domain S-box-containing protein